MISDSIKGRVVAIHKTWDNDHYDYRVSATVSEKDGTFSHVTGNMLTEYDTPDAPKELIQAYEILLENKRKQAQAIRDKQERERESILSAQERARQETKGKTLRVFKGRKIKIGTIGVCFWCGDTKYGVSVGIEYVKNGTLVREFTSSENVIEVPKNSNYENFSNIQD